MNDEQFNSRPACQRCNREHAGFVFYYTQLVCGDCALKLAKAEADGRARWLQEAEK